MCGKTVARVIFIILKQAKVRIDEQHTVKGLGKLIQNLKAEQTN